jgi:hypothetical protein
LQAGEYQVEFSVQPDDLTWTETVHLLPAEHVPDPEPHARWSMANIECCTVNYITGTRAARDLEVVLDLAEMQSENAIRRMGIDFGEPIPITIVPRVVGHGGFASNEIYISYLDENYAGNDLAQVLHHEMIHILDRRLGGELRPSLLVEGLAVYLSNGHFKKEPLLSRAAVLLDLGWYLPLNQLADAFTLLSTRSVTSKALLWFSTWWKDLVGKRSMTFTGISIPIQAKNNQAPSMYLCGTILVSPWSSSRWISRADCAGSTSFPIWLMMYA